MSPLSPQPKETLTEQHQRLQLETDSYADLIRKQKEKVVKVEAKVCFVLNNRPRLLLPC